MAPGLTNDSDADSHNTDIHAASSPNPTAFEQTLLSLLQQQQQTNNMMMQLLQRLSAEPKPAIPLASPSTALPVKSAYISPSELPKFSESISSDDSSRYLGTHDVRNLTDEDRLIVRAFKFLSFRARYTKLTYQLPEEVRLQHLYCCLVGQAQDRAVIDDAATSEELLDRLASWYASATDPGALEDILRQKLELSSLFPNESLSDYISRYSQYFRFAKELSSDFPVSEATACRLFLHSLRQRPMLFEAMVYSSGRKITKLEELFKLTRDCDSNLHIIHASDNFSENSSKQNRRYSNTSYNTNTNFSNRSSNNFDSNRREYNTQQQKPAINRATTTSNSAIPPGVYNYFEDQPIETQHVSRMMLSPDGDSMTNRQPESYFSDTKPALSFSDTKPESSFEDTEAVPPDADEISSPAEISTCRSLRSAVLSVGLITATVPITSDDGADLSVMGCNLTGDFIQHLVCLVPITIRVANGDEVTCRTLFSSMSHYRLRRVTSLFDVIASTLPTFQCRKFYLGDPFFNV